MTDATGVRPRGGPRRSRACTRSARSSPTRPRPSASTWRAARCEHPEIDEARGRGGRAARDRGAASSRRRRLKGRLLAAAEADLREGRHPSTAGGVDAAACADPGRRRPGPRARAPPRRPAPRRVRSTPSGRGAGSGGRRWPRRPRSSSPSASGRGTSRCAGPARGPPRRTGRGRGGPPARRRRPAASTALHRQRGRRGVRAGRRGRRRDGAARDARPRPDVREPGLRGVVDRRGRRAGRTSASFTAAADGTGDRPGSAPGAAAGDVLALTLEPAPGATTPTMPIVASGTAEPVPRAEPGLASRLAERYLPASSDRRPGRELAATRGARRLEQRLGVAAVLREPGHGRGHA